MGIVRASDDSCNNALRQREELVDDLGEAVNLISGEGTLGSGSCGGTLGSGSPEGPPSARALAAERRY